MSDTNLSSDQFFQEFSNRLGIDQYEELREKLIRFFRFKLYSVTYETLEDLVQETMFRMLKQISKGQIIDNIESYAISVAKNVVLEQIRRRSIDAKREVLDLNQFSTIDSHLDKIIEEEDREKKIDCMKKCLDNLEEKDKDLLFTYIQDSRFFSGKKRIELAERENITVPNLRIKIFRLRRLLYKCFMSCRENK